MRPTARFNLPRLPCCGSVAPPCTSYLTRPPRFTQLRAASLEDHLTRDRASSLAPIRRPSPGAQDDRAMGNAEWRVASASGWSVAGVSCLPLRGDDASTARKKQLTLIARRVCPSGERGPTAPGCARVSAYSVAQVGRGLRYGSRFLELEGRTSAHGSGGLLDWGRVKTRATVQPARARSAGRGDLGVGARSTSCPCAGRGGRGVEAKHAREAHGFCVQHAV